MADSENLFDGRAYAAGLTARPGVYRMLDAQGDVIYVGKAHNLRKRVGSYFSKNTDSAKTRSMVSRIHNIEVTVTESEDEALILESTLIKRHRPKYNISLRDDKSYPYVHLSSHAFPQISFQRGQRLKGRYFGPFPSAAAVRDTLGSVHRIFRLRQCDDPFFAHRNRPCLQYQIKRCSAPCVGYIGEADYARDVADAVSLLEGRSNKLLTVLTDRMESASKALKFEEAAVIREQIAAVKRLQGRGVTRQSLANMDIVCADIRGGVAAVIVLSIRDGQNQGHRSYFPSLPPESNTQELLTAFLGQYYLDRPPPAEVIVSLAIPEVELIESALSKKSGRKLQIKTQVRSERKRLLETAGLTLDQLLSSRLAEKGGVEKRQQALAEVLGMSKPARRMECFDISHTSGESTVASCVVFIDGAADKTFYRRYNITGITPGDDYAAIHQAVKRRFAKLDEDAASMPDILFIDGGKGQLSEAMSALNESGVMPAHVVAIAKGPERKAGLEQLLLPGQDEPLILPADSPALHLVQQIRDEAHRFAITGHRGRRGKARTRSELEDITGLGPQRRRNLLTAFGGLRRIERATVSELRTVDGISESLAQRIYDHFHSHK